MLMLVVLVHGFVGFGCFVLSFGCFVAVKRLTGKTVFVLHEVLIMLSIYWLVLQNADKIY